MVKKVRKDRVQNDHFNPDDMYGDLVVYASKKKEVFDWEMADFDAKRGDKGDRDGLVQYFSLLQVVLKHAPACYPALVLLRAVFMLLQSNHSIMSKLHAKQFEKKEQMWADMCGHQVRAATKMVLKLAQADSPYVDPKIKELMAMVDIDKPLQKARKTASKRSLQKAPSISSSDAPEPKRPKKTVAAVRAHDDDDVLVCEVTCRCEDCKKLDPVQDVSDTELQAARLTEHVPVKKGGHKQLAKAVAAEIAEMKKKPAAKQKKKLKVRLFKKTTVSKTKDKTETPVSKTKDKTETPRTRVVRRSSPAMAYVMVDGLWLTACTEKIVEV